MSPRRAFPKADVLVIVAHPDDADFVCGGTIAKLTRERKRLWYVLTTSGDKGTSDRGIPPHELAVRREVEQRNAARELGAKGCVFLGYPDGFVENTVELRRDLVRVIRGFRPDLVITWESMRRTFNHRDHRKTGEAALDAIFPLARDHLVFPELLEEEGLEPHKVEEVWLAGSDDPDYYVDVGDYFHQRLRAIACHVSQVGDLAANEEFVERMRERPRETGRKVGMDYAEAFRRVSFRR